MQDTALNKTGTHLCLIYSHGEGKADTTNYSKSKLSHYTHAQRHQGSFRKYTMIGVMRKTTYGGDVSDRGVLLTGITARHREQTRKHSQGSQRLEAWTVAVQAVRAVGLGLTLQPIGREEGRK